MVAGDGETGKSKSLNLGGAFLNCFLKNIQADFTEHALTAAH